MGGVRVLWPVVGGHRRGGLVGFSYTAMLTMLPLLRAAFILGGMNSTVGI